MSIAFKRMLVLAVSAGATASSSNDGAMVSIGLAGGGVLILTAAGLASRRRKTIAVDA
jgi:hypothetical protein